MPKFLRYCGYDKPEENLEWIVSLHCDRENNYHFHIAWVEKNKCYKFNNNKLGHKLRLKVSDRENNFMKRQVSLTIERAKLYSPALTKINKDIEELQKYFNPKDKNFTLRNINDLELEEKIIRLGFLLSEIRNTDKKYIKYGSLPKNEIGDEIRNITKSIKKELFKKYPEIKNSKKEIYDSIKELNEIFLDIDKRNNISDIGFQTAYDNKLIKDKLEKSDNYILNSIVNHALYNYDISNKKLKKTSKIEFEDLISEAAINIYKNEKYETYKKETYKIKIRKRVLENFFINGGYRNTDKLSNALRRLSKDSEKAAEQFYEMFTDNEKNVEKN